MDLRRVRLDAKTIRVATAHYIAAAKVRVAQKTCQLCPGDVQKWWPIKKSHVENVNRQRSSKGRK
jgi:hypothetical protein